MFQRSGRVALALATIMAAAIAGSAAAATIGETLTVSSTLAVSLDTATFNYTAQPGGVSGTQTANVSVTGNSAFRVDVSGSAFTGPAGTIPASTREITLALASGGTMAPGADAWHSAGTISPVFSGPQPNGTPATFQMQARVNLTSLPAAVAGTYSGTMTVAVSPN